MGVLRDGRTPGSLPLAPRARTEGGRPVRRLPHGRSRSRVDFNCQLSAGGPSLWSGSSSGLQRNASDGRLSCREPVSVSPDDGPGGRCRLDSTARITQTAKEFVLSSSETGSDREIVEGLASGNLQAFERLFSRHGDRMKSIAANLLGSVADAEDAVQDAMLKAYRAAPHFRGGASVSTWLYRILVNTCYDTLRRKKRRAEGPMPAAVALAAGGAVDHPLRLAIEKALSKLDARERTAFLLTEVEGLSHREAGEILDVTETASRALLFQAKRRLQKALSAAGAFRSAESR